MLIIFNLNDIYLEVYYSSLSTCQINRILHNKRQSKKEFILIYGLGLTHCVTIFSKKSWPPVWLSKNKNVLPSCTCFKDPRSTPKLCSYPSRKEIQRYLFCQEIQYFAQSLSLSFSLISVPYSPSIQKFHLE